MSGGNDCRSIKKTNDIAKKNSVEWERM